jgi:hypothetical protein
MSRLIHAFEERCWDRYGKGLHNTRPSLTEKLVGVLLVSARNAGTQGALLVVTARGRRSRYATHGVGRAAGVSRPFARRAMLWTLFVVLLVLWFLGVVSSYTLGGFIHVLLVLALIAVVLQLIQGRRVV